MSSSSLFNSFQTWETQENPPIGPKMQLEIIVIGCMLCSSNLTAHIHESTQPMCINAHWSKQVLMMAYLLQTNEALNPWIGHRSSNCDNDSNHHWPPDAAVIRGSIDNLILSSQSWHNQPIKVEGVTIIAQVCARFTSPFVGLREFGLEDES
jgi:hypothetical protein